MPQVHIPTPLRKYTGNQDAVSVAGGDIQQLIEALEAGHPGIKAHLCDDQGKLRRFVNLFVNDEDIRYLDGLETALKDSDQVSIVPAIAGG